MYRPRVLIADDHALLREAFHKLLETAHEVVGVVADGRALLEAALKLKPDVILLDIAMPVLNGFDAGRQLKKVMPYVKLIYLTINEDPDLAREALRLGGSGYLLKGSAASELFLAVQEVLCGRTYVTSLITLDLGVAGRRKSGDEKTAEKLTVRQREVLQLLAEGRSMKETGALLGVTPRTVAFHKYRLMEAFRLKNNADLIQLAMKQHLVFQPS
ncbi:MAG: response regulator transcription factor [Nitrospirota bacterium]|nr:response regulator transcription factor [Nitrospirota bacterium]